MDLAEFVSAHTDRGECRCGKCIDRGDKPDPAAHTADVFFFPVAMRGTPTLEQFVALTAAHQGEFAACDPLDGNEHSYIEIGGWIGDQGLALLYMGLGALLGAFDLLTPKMLPLPRDLQERMAGAGMVSVQKKRSVQPEAVAAVVPGSGDSNQ